ncbi:MAG TPA: cytochrome c biogenesis protein CcsA [Clostridia bacterium]|nr:cytochrome c biogenesis protein CcsA [Clostridia bacterium]
MAVVYISIVATRFRSGGLAVIGWDFNEKSEIFVAQGQRLFAIVPDLGWIFVLVLLSTVIPIALYFVARFRNDENFYVYANRGMFLTILLQAMALIVFVLRVQNGAYPSAEVQGLFRSALPASPFLLSGMVGSIFAGLLFLLMLWRREGLQKMLPSADNLDQVTYKTIGIAFPLLTLMIATGAYWANQAWGSYWSWDPKETWAAITWLVYAGYLHMRITRGWRGRRAAYFAILGFAVVIFTFFGVTYLLPGLHAYS